MTPCAEEDSLKGRMMTWQFVIERRVDDPDIYEYFPPDPIFMLSLHILNPMHHQYGSSQLKRRPVFYPDL